MTALQRGDSDKTARLDVQSVMGSVAEKPHYFRDIGALPSTARAFLRLSESQRHSQQTLALMAQRDPVMLSRLLCAAMREADASAGLGIATAGAAIEVLGTAKVHALLLPLVHAAAAYPVTEEGSLLIFCERFVLRRCLAHAQTALRLSRYLGLSAAQSALLQAVSMIDSLCLFLPIYSKHPDAHVLHEFIASKEASSSFILRGNTNLPHYEFLARKLAMTWHATDDVVVALTTNDSPFHALLVAIDTMVEAKLRKTSQQAALLETVAMHPCWKERLRMDEIDLAVVPW
ncbi:MAG TPA: hypothetical protein VF472_13575 [Burkholderiaceae bacterium]